MLGKVTQDVTIGFKQCDFLPSSLHLSSTVWTSPSFICIHCLSRQQMFCGWDVDDRHTHQACQCCSSIQRLALSLKAHSAVVVHTASQDSDKQGILQLCCNNKSSGKEIYLSTGAPTITPWNTHLPWLSLRNNSTFLPVCNKKHE